jgi:hypothetical protein
MDATRFDIIALLFTGVGLLGLPRLLRGWRSLVAAEPSVEGEALAVYVAIFLGVPLATLGHELGHLIAAKAFGADDASLHYRVFWGYVSHSDDLSSRANWWVALAGNLVSWALAAFGLLLSRAALPPGLRSAARTFGIVEMIHTLVAYPLFSLGGYPGADWAVIYGRPFWPGAWLVVALHVASLLWLRRELRSAPPAEPPKEESALPDEPAGE